MTVGARETWENLWRQRGVEDHKRCREPQRTEHRRNEVHQRQKHTGGGADGHRRIERKRIFLGSVNPILRGVNVDVVGTNVYTGVKVRDPQSSGDIGKALCGILRPG